MGQNAPQAPRPLRIAVLLLLLVWAQSFTLAHELDHGFSDEHTLCAVCSIGHGLQSGATVSHAPPACEPSSQEPVFEIVIHQPKIQAVAFSARAPPSQF